MDVVLRGGNGDSMVSRRKMVSPPKSCPGVSFVWLQRTGVMSRVWTVIVDAKSRSREVSLGVGESWTQSHTLIDSAGVDWAAIKMRLPTRIGVGVQGGEEWLNVPCDKEGRSGPGGGEDRGRRGRGNPLEVLRWEGVRGRAASEAATAYMADEGDSGVWNDE